MILYKNFGQKIYMYTFLQLWGHKAISFEISDIMLWFIMNIWRSYRLGILKMVLLCIWNYCKKYITFTSDNYLICMRLNRGGDRGAWMLLWTLQVCESFVTELKDRKKKSNHRDIWGLLIKWINRFKTGWGGEVNTQSCLSFLTYFRFHIKA